MIDWLTYPIQWPQNWLQWMAAYFLVGYGIVLFMLTAGLIFRLVRHIVAKPEDKDLSALLKAARAMSNQRFQVLKDIGLWNMMAIAWPVVIGLAFKAVLDTLKSKISHRAEGSDWSPDEQESRFECRMSDLVERVDHLTVADLNLVHDPLGRSPSKPFGHLNPEWERFIDGFIADDAMWSFHIKPNAERKFPFRRMRKGYAIVRDGQVVDEMFVEWA